MTSMTITEAVELAEKLLAEFGLDDWTVKLSGNRRKIGACWYFLKEIELSRVHIPVQEAHVIENTIRHEIAHALAFINYGEDILNRGHGPEWKAMCLVTGAIPKAINKIAKEVEGRYQATCKNCGTESHLHRISKYMRGGKACAKCCTKYSGGRFDRRFAFTYIDTRTGKEV